MASGSSLDLEDELWRQPPPEQVAVAVRCNLNKLSEVDTVKNKAFVSIGIMFYWTDSRLVGWRGPLPSKLWGPRCWFFNALNDLVEDEQDFELSDAAAGRMKRYCRYMGTVGFSEMLLQDFPFDVNEIDLVFRTASHWTSLDKRKGDLASGKSYHLVPSTAAGEGPLFRLLWNGSLHEFLLMGVSMEIKELPTSKSGQMVTTLTTRFHVSRNVTFYLWKVVVPIYMFAVLLLCVFAIAVKDYTSCLENIITLFMASFAMLYVVQSYLPPTNFLTCIDQVVVGTTILLVCAGIGSVILAKVEEDSGVEVALLWNQRGALGFSIFYVLVNFCIFTPSWFRKVNKMKSLAGRAESGDGGKEQDSPRSVLLDGGTPGEDKKHDFFQYLPLDSLSRS
eukprot:TRINITY_DN33785_c0_g1_i1.p1 TRINITY_DN33785_c0_g1~~TRINITY_DN33785_c0_g1_i1.p1  ORF type:complete len:392 (+),score=48.49 TRINITY_DN33785_c0_g1_i1:71-1246(+)